MIGITEQKSWFEKLAKVIETPIYTATNKQEKGKFRPGYQKPLGRILPPLDHRTIGSNEIVIELDAKSFAQNSKYAKMISDYLISQEIPHYNFWSGNKSIHMHIFLNINIKHKDTIEVVKKANSKGCNLFKSIRIKIVEKILEGAGLSTSLIGTGKVVDLAKLDWNDLGGKNTLIRCCGGHNKKFDKIDNSIITGGHKTFLKTLPKSKPKDNTFDKVIYPETIEMYDLPESEVAEIAIDFLKRSEHFTKHQTPAKYEGKHLGLPCVQQILEGLDQGKRSHGALIIALAGRLDKLSKEETNNILKKYVENCSQVPDTFDWDESKEWSKWVFQQQNPFWACAHCKKLDMCSENDCELYKAKFKEEMELFENGQPLKVIKDALDILIVGEDSIKIQTFLIMLTKDFKPEWCLMIDGTAASGKTHLLKNVASMFGKENEEFFVYSRITKSVLNHANNLSEKWHKKIVIIEELQGARDVVEQLRVLISEGKLTLLETVEILNPDGTKTHVANEKIIPFNCLFATCNAEEADEGDQLASRSWILNTDQSEKQTGNIKKYYLDLFEGQNSREVPNIDIIQTALKLLKKPFEVIFPFAKELIEFIPDNLRARRDIKKLITLIKAVAYLHQKDRIWLKDSLGREILIADWRDVLIVYDFCAETMFASSQGIGSNDLKYYDIINGYVSTYQNFANGFGSDDVQRWCQVSRNGARKLMANLIRAGFFENKSYPGVKAEYVKTSSEPVKFKDSRQFILENLAVQPVLTCSWVFQKVQNGSTELVDEDKWGFNKSCSPVRPFWDMYIGTLEKDIKFIKKYLKTPEQVNRSSPNLEIPYTQALEQLNRLLGTGENR